MLSKAPGPRSQNRSGNWEQDSYAGGDRPVLPIDQFWPAQGVHLGHPLFLTMPQFPQHRMRVSQGPSDVEMMTGVLDQQWKVGDGGSSYLRPLRMLLSPQDKPNYLSPDGGICRFC